MWGLGGHGDCGWRVLAASLAIHNGKTEAQIQSMAEKAGRSLRIQTGEYLQREDAWRKDWAFDEEATQRTEDGVVPTSPERWMQAVATRPSRWVCNRTVQAVASAKNLTVVVFLWRGANWQCVARIQPEKPAKKAGLVVPLCIVGEHFVGPNVRLRAGLPSWLP